MIALPSPRRTRERLLADEIAGKLPDARGRFGPFGGRYVPETLMPALERLEAGIRELPASTPTSRRELGAELTSWVGRPTALTLAPRLVRGAGARGLAEARGPRAHRRAQDQQRARPGAAREAPRRAAHHRRDRRRPARRRDAPRPARALGMPCIVYMGAVDMERQAPNVGRMRLLGASVVPVKSGDQTLRAAIDEALRDWVSDPDGTLLPARLRGRPASLSLSGARAAVGHRPRGARAVPRARPAALPDAVVRLRRRRLERDRHVPSVRARDRGVQIIGVEAGGRGTGLGENAATPRLRPARRAARQLLAAAAGRGRPGAGDRTRSPPASTIRASAPSTRCCMTDRPRAVRSGHRRRGAGGAAGMLRSRGHPAGARVRARASSASSAGRAPTRASA